MFDRKQPGECVCEHGEWEAYRPAGHHAAHAALVVPIMTSALTPSKIRFNFLSLNARSLFNKNEELSTLTKKLNPSFVCVQETWCHDGEPDSHYHMSDYSIHRRQSMRRPPKSAEIGVLRPGRSHIQAAFAPMAEEEGDIGLLSVVVWAFLAQCDHFLNKIEFVKDLSLRTKTCNKFFRQFLAEIVQR